MILYIPCVEITDLRRKFMTLHEDDESIKDFVIKQYQKGHGFTLDDLEFVSLDYRIIIPEYPYYFVDRAVRLRVNKANNPVRGELKLSKDDKLSNVFGYCTTAYPKDQCIKLATEVDPTLFYDEYMRIFAEAVQYAYDEVKKK